MALSYFTVKRLRSLTFTLHTTWRALLRSDESVTLSRQQRLDMARSSVGGQLAAH